MEEKTGSLIDKTTSDNRAWQVTTEPAIEPVTLEDLKTFAGIDTDAKDTVLEGYISAVRIATEEYLGRALIEQTIRMLMDYWPGIVVKLPKPPLISITNVFTIDEDDTETVYASSNYYVITESIPGKLVLKQSVSAPTNTDRNYGGFGITLKAGYGDEASDVPAPIKNGIMLWAATVDATKVLDSKNPPPEAKKSLDLFRVGTMLIR